MNAMAAIELEGLKIARPSILAKAESYLKKFDAWPADVQAKVPADVVAHFRGLVAALKGWQ